MRKLLSRLVSGALLLAAVPTPTESPTPIDQCGDISFEEGCLSIDAWGVSVDRVNLTLYKLPRSGRYTDSTKQLWIASFTPYCDVNTDGPIITGDDALCYRALTECDRRGSDAMVAMYMVLDPVIEGPFSQLKGPICFEASAKVDFGPQIQQLVEDEIGAEPPLIALQPTDAIINLPMIASTDPRPPIDVDITDPVVGTATATPEFTWAFAPGAAAHGPGLPYDGTSPTLNPGYYVSYTYGSLGTPTVGLTVTWRVVFTMPGEPPVPLEDVVRINTQTTRVRAAGSELIGG